MKIFTRTRDAIENVNAAAEGIADVAPVVALALVAVCAVSVLALVVGLVGLARKPVTA